MAIHQEREPIPEAVKRFILISIPSVPYLEALLLLRKEADQQWDERMLARRVYIPEPLARELLQALHAAGLAHCEGDDSTIYQYAPVSESLSQIIDLLAESYTKNLVEITVLIHSKAGKKAQQFADAFKLRKDP